MEGLQHSENRYYYSSEQPRQTAHCIWMVAQGKEKKTVAEEVEKCDAV